MFEIAFQSRGEKDYNLNLAKDRHWEKSKRRVLIVLQSAPTISLTNRELLTDYVRTTLVNCINTARRMARAIDESTPDYAYAVVNFNNYKHLNLKGSAKAEAEATFATRIRRLIKKLDPTHVLISGDQAAMQLLPDESHIQYKRGWVFKKKGRRYTTTFDLDACFRKNFMYADLLGFWCRHLSHLLVGRHPYSLKDLLVKPRYIGTIDDFKKMMRRIEGLKSTDLLAVDTETLNLSSRSNAVYTIQFCLSTDPTVGFVLPIQHPKTPFDASEIAYIHKRLAAYFSRSRESTPTLITFNGNFDLKVIRAELKLPIIYSDLWEIRAGEHLLDENISALSKVGPPMGGLAAVLASYGNDFYYTATFSKNERSTSGLVEPDNKDFLMYGAYDVCSIMSIRQQQLRRAAREELNGKSYKPWFVAHMHHIMGATTHTISHLEADGSYVDQKYLRSLLASDSPLRLEIKKQEDRLRKSKAGIAANKSLLADAGLTAGSLWGDDAGTWMLKLSKSSHKAKLFFEILGLDPVSETKKGQPAIDKEFIETYAHRVPEVQILGDWSKRSTLLGTYVKGWLRRLMKDIDGRKDSYLRSSYSFFQVVTGRLGSWDPNLQNIPSRGILSKIIKAMFTTTKGRLLIRFDYSAHEVRMWAIAAADKVLADSFLSGLQLRQQLIQAIDEEVVAKIRAELKTKGDVHIQNVFRFWKKWVIKDDPLRDAVKAVVFGVLYGLSPKSLGKSIGPFAVAAKELKGIERKYKEADKETRIKMKARRVELKAFLATASDKEQERQNTEYAQSIIDKMFDEFKKGGQWTNKMKELAEKKGYAYSPFGRKRHLWATLTGVRSLIAGSVRQGSNAPIQGYASESGVRSSRDVAVAYYTALPELAELLNYSTEPEALQKLWIEFNRIVHDALYHGVPYEMVIPFIHILQWHSTFGLAAALGKEFNINFLVPPEIEIEVGAQDTRSYKWDWTMPGLAKILDQSVQDAASLDLLDRPIEEVMENIYRPYKSKKVRNILQERWPLLNVPDLTKNIKSMESMYLSTLKSDKKEYKRYKSLRSL